MAATLIKAPELRKGDRIMAKVWSDTEPEECTVVGFSAWIVTADMIVDCKWGRMPLIVGTSSEFELIEKAGA